MNISINGKSFTVVGSAISYEKVVELAGLKGSPSVVYHAPRQGDLHRDGIMHPGCAPVLLEESLRFECVHTGNA